MLFHEQYNIISTMKVEIINEVFKLDLYGFSGIVLNKNDLSTAFKLMDKMWDVVKAKNLKTKGLNIWVYESNEKVFAGVELLDNPKQETSLEQKSLSLLKYAYYKHIGPYNLIKQKGQIMIDEIKKKGFEIDFPYIEIYGHWTNNERELETELLMLIK